MPVGQDHTLLLIYRYCSESLQLLTLLSSLLSYARSHTSVATLIAVPMDDTKMMLIFFVGFFFFLYCTAATRTKEKPTFKQV